MLESVTRNFGALRAIEDVSFSVAAGERRAVIGANGAGKTTLFNVITGDFPATAGRVLFFGEDVTLHPPFERIRSGLRRTYQSSLLFRDLTVRDNLFLAVRGVTRNRYSFFRSRNDATVDQLLERVRLSRVADQPVSSLSHGQQRQLEIGMALAGAPRLILFDEPAAGLGPGAQHRGGHDRADSLAGEQIGAPGPHQHQDGLAVGGLAGQLPDPTGQAPQGRGRGGGLQVPAGLDAQPGAGGHELAGRAEPEPFPQDLGCGDDQRAPVALGVAGGLDGRAPGGQPHRERGSWTGRLGLGQLITAQHFAGGPDRVQRIRLGAMAAGGRLGRSSATTCSA